MGFAMNETKFVYVTYIRTTPEKLWQALTTPEFNRQFWFDAYQDCDWEEGSTWKLMFDDGRVADSGAVLEIIPRERLVLKWRNEWQPDVKADGYTRCTFEIEAQHEMVKLTVTHEADRPHKLLAGVTRGWPQVLSSLKSLLETGKALPRDEGLRH